MGDGKRVGPSRRSTGWRRMAACAMRRDLGGLCISMEMAGLGRDNRTEFGYNCGDHLNAHALITAVFLVMLNPLIRAAGSSLVPNLIIVNATVRTQERALSKASAVAILGNRIVALGATSDIRWLAGPGTTVIDAEGK